MIEFTVGPAPSRSRSSASRTTNAGGGEIDGDWAARTGLAVEEDAGPAVAIVKSR